MNFNNYTRIQLGIPPASSESNMAAARRARMMGLNGFAGFGQMVLDKSIPLEEFYGRPNDKWDIWANAAARTWAKVTGDVTGAIKLRNRAVDLNDPTGKLGWFSSCSLLPLGSDPNNCRDYGIPLAAGLACRGLPLNFNPCESNTRLSEAEMAQRFGMSLEAFFKKREEYSDKHGQPPVETEGTGGGDADTGSGATEEKKDNTALLIAGGVAAVGLIAFFAMRKK